MDKRRGWVLKAWAPCCGIEVFSAYYSSFEDVRHWNYLEKRWRRTFFPTYGPYRWRQWHKGGQLKVRYQEAKFRPSLIPQWTVSMELPECKERS